MSFVHLHVHSEYSLLDGFSKLKTLVERTKQMNMPAVALTDHGTMFGVIEFYNTATAAGVKPIIGLESYMAARGMREKDSRLDKQSSHLLLLAENQVGYRNLLAIASAAQLEGFYYFPRIDHEFLAAHSEGLIASSGCMSAEIPRAIREGDMASVHQKLDWYYQVFGKERFFLELQEHNVPDLMRINKTLLEIGPKYQARYIATNDAHYVDREDYRYQDILLAIQTGALLSDPSRMRMTDQSYYLRSPEEMSALFSEVPEAIQNTLLIAERCNVDLDPQGYHLPIFDVPEGFTAQTYLRKLCDEGMRRRYGEHALDPRVSERLEYELNVIHQMGFDAYFLIVWDLCHHAREEGIWYNARGSAAGSLVAYTLDITLVEPLEHDLIFERFLNPGRISMPDIDLDFQDDKRSMVMEYCAHKYGNDKVAQIITFGTLGARAAIRDVGRVMDIPLSEVDRVSKLIPNIPSKPFSIQEALETIPEFKAIYDEAQYLRDLIDTASHMEGVVRNAGTHAAGVVITDRPLTDYVPLHRPTSGSEDSPIKSVSQFEMAIVESQGLLKVDFLGLSSLTVMQRACKLIAERHGIPYTLDNIPLDDAETFQFLGEGHTAGVFQLEGTGMTRNVVQMKPKNLANIIAMVALFRPGPMDFIPSYIRRMHGDEVVEYRHPRLEPIFKETYGIPVYQEQIMRAAVDLAGYTLSESDELRKAISKKQKDKLLKHQEKFTKGAVENGIAKQTAEEIFGDWEEFARYGFNKSHAADYGVIAIQTAWLKTHYTVEYMTALLSASKNDSDKVAFYVADCRSMGIDVLPPDVCSSGWDFSIEDREGQNSAIRFGLGAVKNVGQAPVDLFLLARTEQPFQDLNDFSRRVDLRQVGKRSLECLIKVGALDCFGQRVALLDAMDRLIALSTSHFRAIQSGQMSFFGAASGMEEQIVLNESMLVDKREQLEWERELIGLYVSDHPLTPYLPNLKRKVSHFSAQLSDAHNKEKVTVAGLVTRFRKHQTKTGKDMGFCTLEDIQGNIELVLFPRTWDQYNGLIAIDQVLVAEGKIDNESGDPKVLVDRLMVEVLEDLPEGMAGFNYMPDAPGLPNDPGDLPDERETGARIVIDDVPLPTQNTRDFLRTAESPAAWQSKPPLPKERGNVPPPPEEPDDWLIISPDGEQFLLDAPAMATSVEAADDSQAVAFASAAPIAVATTPLDGSTNITPVESSPPPAAFVPFSYLGNPAVYQRPGERLEKPEQPRLITIILRASNDKERDNRRMRRVYGLLRSSPGRDHFSLMVFEKGHFYMIDFPNDTTGITSDLLQKLIHLAGEENVRVEPIRIQ